MFKSVLGKRILQTALAHFPSDDIAKRLHEISGDFGPLAWLKSTRPLLSFIYPTAKWQILRSYRAKVLTFIWPSCQIFPPETGSAAGTIVKCVMAAESCGWWKFQGLSATSFGMFSVVELSEATRDVTCDAATIHPYLRNPEWFASVDSCTYTTNTTDPPNVFQL